ncbi:M67 family metallopeptidase [Candidatus Woesearchaeota archaeon]|nr:M67 family metallopeptidase [Candidatus Woesearchaeota archaeon]
MKPESGIPFFIPRKVVLAMLHHVQQQPEQEVCGLVGGRGGKALSYYPVENVAACRSNRFSLDEVGQIAAMKTMRIRQEELLGIFHSHPEGLVEPSVMDEALSGYPEALMLIGSAGTRGVLELRGFDLKTPDRRVEVELVMEG